MQPTGPQDHYSEHYSHSSFGLLVQVKFDLVKDFVPDAGRGMR